MPSFMNDFKMAVRESRVGPVQWVGLPTHDVILSFC